jgi:signal peptidase I
VSVATQLAEQTPVPAPIASPGRRLGAYAIDAGVTGILTLIIALAAGNLAAYELVLTFVLLLYFAGFEGSRLQASPGKLLVGIKVVSSSGCRLSFRRALARTVAKIPTAGLAFFFRLIRGRPAWHDGLVSTAVVHRDFDGAAIPATGSSSRTRRVIGWGIVGIVFGLLLFSGGDRAFTFPIRIIGNAMAPTYTDGQRVTVQKLSYLFHSPQRGDVIVFQATSAGYPHRIMLARIVGLPGETVEVRNAVVRIDGQVLYEPYEAQPPDYSWGPKKVPAGSYFVLADNRNDAFDSHNWPVSPWVTRGQIEGKAGF